MTSQEPEPGDDGTEQPTDHGGDLGEPYDSIAEIETPLELTDKEALELRGLGEEARHNLDVTLSAVLDDLEEDQPVVKYATVAALDESLDDLKEFTARFREITEDMIVAEERAAEDMTALAESDEDA